MGMKDANVVNSHYSSMNRVYEYIDNNLTENLSLAVLSQISGYSAYHFHRIFHALTGKTLHDYVFERKIYSAASRLLYEESSITQIAYESGFSSSSSFVRSFRKIFGCSPSSFRKDKVGKRPEDLPSTGYMGYQADEALEKFLTSVDLPDFTVAGIVTQGLSKEFSSKHIEKAFKSLFAWLIRRNLATPEMQVMGITLDTPEIVPFTDCRYFACVLADETFSSEGEVTVRTFPTKGRYIRFSMERTQPEFARELFKVTDYLYGFHMPNLGIYPDNRPFIEIYSSKGSQIIIDFHVPVR